VGINLLHVPYREQAEALLDVMSGRVDLNFSSVGGELQNVKVGRLRALGLASRQRFAGLAEVPTIAESGYPDFEIAG